ncbi:MAG: hypothetical protein DMG61_18000 [Acidobacteria bacterium]|nr:MAG: hypothetical protein DMG61_18000 [Acidobacteriota bacterium]PYY19484.1 MAG: hypothetical protein DMG60_04300 [Acidobacteriota bacterium]
MYVRLIPGDPSANTGPQDASFTIGVKLILFAGSGAELFINDHETSTACFLSCVALLHGL